jgi:quercetin dioxygenase-like cupin family protein
MKPISRIQFAALGVILGIWFPVTKANAEDRDAPRETSTPAFVHDLANVPGKTLTAILVAYPPGGKTPSHRHGHAFVIGYVLEGSIRSKTSDGQVRVFHAGESWTEDPGVHHETSENASDTESAKLLAIFIADTGDKDLFVPDQR